MKWILPKTYRNPIFSYSRSSDQDLPYPNKYEVIVVGTGPTGLTTALDLARRGIATVVLAKGNTVSVGSRAICFAKRSLEVANRLGVEECMLQKGITWNVGKVFFDTSRVYEFNLLPEKGHKLPAFINLQQYYYEEYLIRALMDTGKAEIRWQNEVVAINTEDDYVSLTIDTPEGRYTLHAAYLIACDGVNSTIRRQLNIPYKGEEFEENFLIADITMEHTFPKERWFWFDPPFNRGYSALLHKQPDGVWRIDLQLGPQIDKEQELEPDRIRHRIQAMLGEEVTFELEWTSIYQFRCMRMDQFVHGRVIFAGDAAHLVSPFGARGANGGIQDADNLSWKLAYVIQGKAPLSLLNTYDEERSPAADENIYHSTNATDFISPKSNMSRAFRDAALELAPHHTFARKLINSGRLSHPFRYVNSTLTTSDVHKDWDTELQPGYPVKDAPFRGGYLIDHLGPDFTLLMRGKHTLTTPETVALKVISITESDEEVIRRYDLQAASWYLFRPDHHIAARGRAWDVDEIKSSFYRAIGRDNKANTESTAIEDMDVYEQDALYKMLIHAHKGLSKEASEKLNLKLILLLLSKIKDQEEWNDLLAAALK